MSRLTITKRNDIENKEVRKKFHDLITKAEKSFKDEILKEARKTVPSWVTDEMIDSKYINTNNEIHIKGIVDPNNLSYHQPKKQLDGYCLSSYIPTKRHSHINVKVTKTIQNKIDKVTKLKKESEVFRRKIRNVLVSFKSINKALELLPELKEHFLDHPKAKALMPYNAIKEIKGLLVVGKVVK